MNKGAILIITLWILAILAILSIGIGGRMGLELKLTGFNRDSASAMYLAKAGVKRAIAVIVGKKDHTVDSLNEPWSCNNDNEETKPLFKEIRIGDAGFFTVSYAFSDKQVFYGVQDEAARININTASKDVIKQLIISIDQAVADADEIAAHIVDWRELPDPDNSRQHDDYSGEGYPRKGKSFDSVNELLLVKGVKEAGQGRLFDKIKGYITVYTTADSGKVNINTAPLPVIRALGFSEENANAIIARRAGSDNSEEVSAPFTKYGDFTEYLVNAGITPPKDISSDIVSCGSKYFRVISKGSASSGRITKTVTCVISATDGNILYWNEE